ncbi:MAG: hypothetical protein RBT41_05540 [Clostridia bacterium]|nr:hypothetical protein [Clostridia bacterium]
MSGLIKIHLVYPEIKPDILQEVAKYCQITALHASLDEAFIWSKQVGGEEPDLILINSAEHFNAEKEKIKKKELLLLTAGIKANRPRCRIVLLIPERFSPDLQLITEMLRLELYNFWFLDAFNETDLLDFIFTERTLCEVETYLKEKETAQAAQDTIHQHGIIRNLNRLYQPYHIKSNIIAFSSEDDSLINYALAVLTALELAEHGFKVSLIETVGSIPRLAGMMSVPHPYFNTRHAVAMYAQRNNDFLHNCFFNKEIYLADKHSPAPEKYIEEYPPELYFLPDGLKKDNLDLAETEKHWPDFIHTLSRITIFEKGHQFLIFICQGHSSFNELILQQIAYLKFITVNMLPGSIVYGLNVRKEGGGKVHLIGVKHAPYIDRQLAELGEAPLFYAPDCLYNDFLEYVYLKKKNRITPESRAFIARIAGNLGVRMEQVKDKGGLNGLRKILKI